MNLSLSCDSPERLEEVKALRERLNLAIDNQTPLQLAASQDKWMLKMRGADPMWVDFDPAHWRKGKSLSREEGLVRACKPQKGMTILDLTAGFGRDAALLCAWGATVILVERDPIMQILLEDGVRRALRSGLVEEGQVQLLCSDAKTVLLALKQEARPHIIYLDPMHPGREKSAKVKKIMQSMQSWIKPDEDTDALLALARTRALDRVVVKWPARLAPLTPPNHSITGKTVRFDVYLPSS